MRPFEHYERVGFFRAVAIEEFTGRRAVSLLSGGGRHHFQVKMDVVINDVLPEPRKKLP